MTDLFEAHLGEMSLLKIALYSVLRKTDETPIYTSAKIRNDTCTYEVIYTDVDALENARLTSIL